MPYEPTTAWRLPEEVHRYFPEWADRPESVGLLREADHNSYLAGGYSEEFGYRVRPDRPPIFPLLLEDPERSDEWCVQIGCLHPGYPECARPADRDGSHTRDGLMPDQQDIGSHSRGGRPPPEGHTQIVRVNRELAGRRFRLFGPIGSFRARWRMRRELDRIM